jgi:hypothetical protein
MDSIDIHLLTGNYQVWAGFASGTWLTKVTGIV